MSAVLGAYFALHWAERIEVTLRGWEVRMPVLMVCVLWAIFQILLGLNLATPTGGVYIGTLIHGVRFVIGFAAIVTMKWRAQVP